MTAPQFLQARNLSKTFDDVTVVRRVDLDVRVGEVVGLVGPNGCGKSTIIKMLSGFHQPDPGSELVVDGRALTFGEGRRARNMAFVHQDLAFFPDGSIMENLALADGYRVRRLWRIDWASERARAREILAVFGIRATPEYRLSELSTADVTLFAIARALSSLPHGPSLLVLDEPTSSLTDAEVRRVLQAIRDVAGRGSAVLFVSHRLGEVIAVSDRVVVMRDGDVVCCRAAADLTTELLVELMLGRPCERIVRGHGAAQEVPPVLELLGLSGRRLQDFDLTVRPGEIVGVTGLLGSGKSELGRILAAADRPARGRILVDGKRLAAAHPSQAIKAGISYVPPERRTQGGIPGFSALENVTLPDLGEFMRRGRIDGTMEARETRNWMGLTRVIPPDPKRRFSTFSGGNQQKLVFAKWLRTRPRILVLDEPTQGVDAGAIQDLYELIRVAAADGCAVVLLSSEWDELPRICQRVVVLDKGRVVATLPTESLSGDDIAAAAYAAGRASHGS